MKYEIKINEEANLFYAFGSIILNIAILYTLGAMITELDLEKAWFLSYLGIGTMFIPISYMLTMKRIKD